MAVRREAISVSWFWHAQSLPRNSAPGMAPAKGRVFACLYARSDRVPKACADAAQDALEEAR